MKDIAEALVKVAKELMSADTFKCPNCGSKVLEQTGYCVKCKKKVKKATGLQATFDEEDALQEVAMAIKRSSQVSDAWFERNGDNIIVNLKDGREFSVGTDYDVYEWGDTVEFWITDISPERVKDAQKKVYVKMHNERDTAKQLLKALRRFTASRGRVAESGIDRIVKKFDYLEGRWQDESEYEDFREYQQVAKKAVEKQGFRFVSLSERPMKLKFKGGGTDYTVRVKGSQIVVDKRE